MDTVPSTTTAPEVSLTTPERVAPANWAWAGNDQSTVATHASNTVNVLLRTFREVIDTSIAIRTQRFRTKTPRQLGKRYFLGTENIGKRFCYIRLRLDTWGRHNNVQPTGESCAIIHRHSPLARGRIHRSEAALRYLNRH